MLQSSTEVKGCYFICLFYFSYQDLYNVREIEIKNGLLLQVLTYALFQTHGSGL